MFGGFFVTTLFSIPCIFPWRGRGPALQQGNTIPRRFSCPAPHRAPPRTSSPDCIARPGRHARRHVLSSTGLFAGLSPCPVHPDKNTPPDFCQRIPLLRKRQMAFKAFFILLFIPMFCHQGVAQIQFPAWFVVVIHGRASFLGSIAKKKAMPQVKKSAVSIPSCIYATFLFPCCRLYAIIFLLIRAFVKL